MSTRHVREQGILRMSARAAAAARPPAGRRLTRRPGARHRLGPRGRASLADLVLVLPVPPAPPVRRHQRTGRVVAMGEDVHFTGTTRLPTDVELEKATRD